MSGCAAATSSTHPWAGNLRKQLEDFFDEKAERPKVLKGPRVDGAICAEGLELVFSLYRPIGVTSWRLRSATSSEVANFYPNAVPFPGRHLHGVSTGVLDGEVVVVRCAQPELSDLDELEAELDAWRASGPGPRVETIKKLGALDIWLGLEALGCSTSSGLVQMGRRRQCLPFGGAMGRLKAKRSIRWWSLSQSSSELRGSKLQPSKVSFPVASALYSGNTSGTKGAEMAQHVSVLGSCDNSVSVRGLGGMTSDTEWFGSCISRPTRHLAEVLTVVLYSFRNREIDGASFKPWPAVPLVEFDRRRVA